MRRLVFLALLFLARSAHADVGVVVVGEATMQPQLVAQLEQWLRSHGHQIAAAPLPPEAISTIVDCFVMENETCAREVIDQRARTQSVVFARIDVKLTEEKPVERMVTLTAYWFEKKHGTVAERRLCNRCTDVTLRTTADDLMSALTINTRDVGTLKLTSTPSAARVLVDGSPVGITPLSYEVKPGTHAVTLQRDGTRDDKRDVEIKRGETTQVDVFLKSYASKNFFPFLVIGAGGVMLATGLVLFAMDEDQQAPKGQQKEFYSNTAPLGVGLMVGGAVVGGVGAYLLFRSKRSSAPVAAVTSDTAYVGWAGRF